MAGMRRYLLSRFAAAIPVVLGVTIIVFSILHLTPGDPVSLIAGPRASVERLEEIRVELGLDKPFHIQYLRWLADVLRGDFGRSLSMKRPAAELIIERLPYTLELTVTALITSVLLGIPLGVASAVKQYTVMDHISMGVALFWLSMPGFWLGLMLMLLFGLRLGWLPISGSMGITSLILPALTLGLPQVGMIARLMRSEMLEVLREDYVKTARAKGLREFLVMYKHVLRNAIIPVMVILFLAIPWLISGAVVVETVFAWPGMGRLMYRAILIKDFPIVQGVILIIAILTVICNFLGDVVTGLLDPRIRYD
jgi:ABC-type dipeptide/oligopeptide/nickel transport system permease component